MISELPWPIATKLCHVIYICDIFIMHVQKFRGPSSKKFGGPKNMQNFGRFYTTYDFDREYLRNDTRYQKSERYTTSNDSSCVHVQPNKSGELWSTIHKVLHVSLDPPKSTFSTNYISAPSGCWTLKFLHALDTGQGLLARTANRVRGPPKNFKGEHLKLGLKFHTWAPITLGVVGVPSRNITRGRGSRPGWSCEH